VKQIVQDLRTFSRHDQADLGAGLAERRAFNARSR